MRRGSLKSATAEPIQPQVTSALLKISDAAPEPLGQGGTGLSTRIVDLAALEPADLEKWRSLARHAIEPNPFAEPELVLPAFEHLEGGLAELLVVEDDKAWHACLPVGLRRLKSLLAVQRTSFYTHCFSGTPLLGPDRTDVAAAALLELALGDRRPPLLIQDLIDGPAGDAIRAAIDDLSLVVLRERRADRALLQRRPEGGYLDSMKSHRRRELNRLGRRLEVALGNTITITDEADRESAYATFLELEASGWKGSSATALGSDPGGSAFFLATCAAFRDENRLELLCLRVGDRAVAMKCNVYSGEGAFCFKIAYDEEFASFSPGVQLERENVRLFDRRQRCAWQDSCADPENTMINRLWPDRRAIRTILLAPSGFRASALRRGIAVADERKGKEGN